jgi:hypothetical protein
MMKFTQAMTNLRLLLIADGDSEATADTKMRTFSSEVGSGKNAIQLAASGNYSVVIECANASSVLTPSQKSSFADELNS